MKIKKVLKILVEAFVGKLKSCAVGGVSVWVIVILFVFYYYIIKLPYSKIGF